MNSKEKRMKDYIKNIIEENLNDEVDVEKEWKRFSASRLSSGPTRSVAQGMRKMSRQFSRYAAAVLIGFGVSLVTFHLIAREDMTEVGICKAVTLKGEKTQLQLPDGTKVWLNSCTTIEYAENYGHDNRDIHLTGEAYFEVAKNENTPFTVRVCGVEVKALGTAFNISAYPEDEQLVTTLFCGAVVIQPALTRQQITLAPDQVAVYHKNDNKIEVMPYDRNLFAQWRGGYLTFDMMYLQDITKLLERNYNVVFRYENQKIKNFKFSGSFRNSEDLTEILDVIRTNTGIRYQKRRDTIVIR